MDSFLDISMLVSFAHVGLEWPVWIVADSPDSGT